MMRHARHPGPVSLDPLELQPAEGQAVQLTLRGGIPLLQSVAEALETVGADSAWLRITAAEATNLTYVAPAAARDATTLAWYSAPLQFPAGGRIERLGMIVGKSGPNCFLHGHGLWRAPDGPLCMGHILPDETVLAKDTQVTGFTFTGARFDRLPDAETNFDLFRPVALKTVGSDRFALLRMGPNIDFPTALSLACQRLGWSGLRAHGVGSLIGVTFVGDQNPDWFETEFLLETAHCDADNPMGADVTISIVGRDSEDPREGRLVPGGNPVLITAEIVLERTDV